MLIQCWRSHARKPCSSTSLRIPPEERSEEHTSELQSRAPPSSDLRGRRKGMRQTGGKPCLSSAGAAMRESHVPPPACESPRKRDRKSTRLNSSHVRRPLPICVADVKECVKPAENHAYPVLAQPCAKAMFLHQPANPPGREIGRAHV